MPETAGTGVESLVIDATTPTNNGVSEEEASSVHGSMRAKSPLLGRGYWRGFIKSRQV
jgi:hypothetical protein